MTLSHLTSSGITIEEFLTEQMRLECDSLRCRDDDDNDNFSSVYHDHEAPKQAEFILLLIDCNWSQKLLLFFNLLIRVFVGFPLKLSKS